MALTHTHPRLIGFFFQIWTNKSARGALTRVDMSNNLGVSTPWHCHCHCQGWIQTSATSLHKLVKIHGGKEFQNLIYIKFLINSRPHFINIPCPLPSSTFVGQEMLVMREKLARKQPASRLSNKREIYRVGYPCVKSAVLPG